jgi:hypothetical protein
VRATWSTAGALAALALPVTATAADAPTVPATTTDAAVAPPASTTAAPATPATPSDGAAPPATDPAAPATDPSGPASGPEGPGTTAPSRPDAQRDPLPDVVSTGDEDDRGTRDGDDERKARKDGQRAKDEKGDEDRAAKDDEKANDPKATDAASSAADLLLGGSSRGLADLSVKDFRIPPFLLPIYQAAGVQYGIRWEILAAINEIETDYGRNLSVSTAGALGWMQFMPGTWKAYGVDATGDGQRDPYNPVDAIFAAARYLQASGAATDIRKAIFAYNHADWYVDDVLRRARAIARLPAEVVASLSGLTLAQLPVYAPDPDGATEEAGPEADADGATEDAGGEAKPERAAPSDAKAREADAGETAKAEEDAPPLVDVAPGGSSEWATVRAPEDAPVVAVQDATVTRIGESPRWGRYVELRDAFGNRYAYTHLGELATEHLTSKEDAQRADDAQPLTPAASAEPTSPPTATSPVVGPARPRSAAQPGGPVPPPAPAAGPDQALNPPPAAPSTTTTEATPGPTATAPVLPTTTTETAPPTTTETAPPPTATGEATATAAQPPADVPASARPEGPAADAAKADDTSPVNSAADDALIARYVVRASGLRRSELRVRPLREGSKLMAGTILGRLDPARRTVVEDDESGARRTVSSFRFAIRPAGKDSGRIDPRPILDGWRLLDDAAVFGNRLPTALAADKGDQPDVGRVLLQSKQQLQQRVLSNPRLTIYPAGREDIRAGVIDRRVLATMEYLTAHGLRLTITSLKTGHSYLSKSGNVSAHSYGAAMDIAVVNGTVISAATQGPGSITDRTNRLLLRLQGTMRPNQIISLMTYPGTDNTLAMADHDDHIHVGFPRAADSDDGPVRLASLKVGDTTLAPGLRHDQWQSLIDQLGTIENPKVQPKVSSSALPDPKVKKGRAG